jgi:mono/diheme cytochrome c family protein
MRTILRAVRKTVKRALEGENATAGVERSRLMPGFKHSMTDSQLTELVSYLRQQFAPD